jgi:hypothetical protein
VSQREERMSDRTTPDGSIDRRAFLTSLGAGAAALAAFEAGGRPAEAAEIAPQNNEDRRAQSKRVRNQCADLAFNRPLPLHPTNGEEEAYPFVAQYSKALPHNVLGEVDSTAYNALLAALASGDPADFEAIPLAGAMKLTNPQAGLAFDLEGPDGHHLAMPPVPRIDGPENSAEMVELYWMAHLRDLDFTDYEESRLAEDAAADLSRMTDFRGPKDGRSVTPATLFRGNTPGDLVGPYLSQFLLKDIPYGSLTISQQQSTVNKGTDFMTDYEEWLAVQNGAKGNAPLFKLAKQPQFIRNGRDLAHYVHLDALYEAYLNACLILLGMGAALNDGNPYKSAAKQIGFGTFGGPHILSLVTEVATRALKAVWYQKWFVHRRLRPEELGGRIHNHLSGAASYPIDPEVLDSDAVDRTLRKHGTALLPQAFEEGCPSHPAYGSGHATVAGACVTILKAWFDASFVIPDPVVPTRDRTKLRRYEGADAHQLTVGGELNKVAANIASGRNFSGIHWRTDFTEGLNLGEAVAIGVLEEQKTTYNETHSFTLTKFDGTTITI